MKLQVYCSKSDWAESSLNWYYGCVLDSLSTAEQLFSLWGYGQPKPHLLAPGGIFWLLPQLFRARTFELAAPQTLSDFGM